VEGRHKASLGVPGIALGKEAGWRWVVRRGTETGQIIAMRWPTGGKAVAGRKGVVSAGKSRSLPHNRKNSGVDYQRACSYLIQKD